LGLGNCEEGFANCDFSFVAFQQPLVDARVVMEVKIAVVKTLGVFDRGRDFLASTGSTSAIRASSAAKRAGEMKRSKRFGNSSGESFRRRICRNAPLAAETIRLWREARRFTGLAVDQIRVRHQPANRQGAWP
jgi:hypothetical protein